jgi:hypothetical protein
MCVSRDEGCSNGMHTYSLVQMMMGRGGGSARKGGLQLRVSEVSAVHHSRWWQNGQNGRKQERGREREIGGSKPNRNLTLGKMAQNMASEKGRECWTKTLLLTLNHC